MWWLSLRLRAIQGILSVTQKSRFDLTYILCTSCWTSDYGEVKNKMSVNQWKHGLCGCFDNCELCIITYFVPCYTAGKVCMSTFFFSIKGKQQGLKIFFSVFNIFTLILLKYSGSARDYVIVTFGCVIMITKRHTHFTFNRLDRFRVTFLRVIWNSFYHNMCICEE